MRKRIYLLLIQLLLVFIFSGCCKEPLQTACTREEPSCRQLYPDDSRPEQQPEPVIAAWIPYFTVAELLSAGNADQAAADIYSYLQRLRETGINTVFVHVCAFGETVYPSAYYPMLPAADGLDVMRLFSDSCRELGLSFHAWINPLRLQTSEYMEAQKDGSLLQTWYRDPALRKERLSEWDGRFYLNPAAESTGTFLTDALTELIVNHHPDGIHIDDYFYPTAETAFDAAEFSASGADDLFIWRRGNITKLMQRINTAVHAADHDIVFSVSPQGNMSENQNKQFADVPAWLTETPVCDWIIPQLYFGYQNETAPYAQLLREWTTLPGNDHVRLIIGLAAYKVGETDPFAGSGSEEWQTAEAILAKQAADALGESNVSGIAFYHADALLALPENEMQALQSTISAGNLKQ